FLLLPPPPSSPLFPYTTLFRSSADEGLGRERPVRRARPPDRVAAPAPPHPQPGRGLQPPHQPHPRAGRPGGRHGGLHRAHHPAEDRKSTRLNSSHVEISYAVFC